MSTSPKEGLWVELTCDGNRRLQVNQLAAAGQVVTAATLTEAQAYACNKIGGQVTQKIIEAARDEMIGLIALWAWSTKNWDRPLAQQTAVFAVVNEFLVDLENEWMDRPENQDVRLVHMGRTEKLEKSAPEMMDRMQRVMDKTRERTGMVVALMMDYAGPDEDERARELWKKDQTGKPFTDFLDLPRQGVPYKEVDLRIRTGETSEAKHINAVMRPYEGLETRDIFHEFLLAEYSPDALRNDLATYRKTEKRNGK